MIKYHLTLYMLVSSADNLRKQFGTHQAQQNIGPDLNPLKVFMKEFFLNLILKKTADDIK